MIPLALILACAVPVVEPGPLSPVALATRRSLDLRGVRPSPAELVMVANNPLALDDLTEIWVHDDRFAARVAWIWNDALHTALYFEDYQRFGALTEDQWSAIGQEPLRLIQEVVAEDRPFSEILTADHTLANGALSALWGLDGGEDWAPATYTDGRAMAGLLSSTSLWNRYNADITNRNRARANTVARVFLCADFFDREVDFDFDLDGLENVETAVHNEPSCQGCHAALDPLASFFGGFAERSQEEDIEQYRTWSPWTADWYAAWVPPGVFGAPGRDLADLGALLAADSRFSTCAATRLYEGLTGSALTDSEEDEVLREQLGEEFRALGLQTRELAAWIVQMPGYEADDERVLTSEQLDSSLSEALGLDTPTTLTDGLAPLSWSAEARVLAGGTDDDTVLVRSREPGLGAQVTALWAARRAVGPAIEADMARDPADRLLFTLEDPDGDWNEGLVRRQLTLWRARLLSELVQTDGDEIDRLYDLWVDAGGRDDPEAALTVVLAALVRHPRGLIY